MKCFVPARAFRKRLAAVAAVVPRHCPKPILQTVRLEVDAHGKGTLAATDLETWVRVGLPALRATRPGVVQLPPRALATILDESGTGEVELDADPDAFALVCREAELPCRLVVTDPRSRSTLSTYRPEEFPAREEPPSSGHHAIERHHLAGLIRRTAFAVDPSCTRYQLGGCSFGLGEGSIDVVATDGCRLAHAWTRGVRVVGSPAEPACHALEDPRRALATVVGARPLRVLLRLLDELKSVLEPAEINWTTDGWLRVRSKDLQFSSRQLAGRFPSWRETFPPPSPHRGHFARSDQLLAILKRAKMLAHGNRPTLRIGLRRGGLTLSLASGTGVERFETYCDCRSEPSEAVLDARALIEALEAVGGEAVDLELNGPGIPCVLHAAGFRYCMMPLDSGPSATADRSGVGLGSEEEADEAEDGALESRLPDSAC